MFLNRKADVPCILECSEAKDHIAHYMVCPMLGFIVQSSFQHLNLSGEFQHFWASHTTDSVYLKIVACIFHAYIMLATVPASSSAVLTVYTSTNM